LPASTFSVYTESLMTAARCTLLAAAVLLPSPTLADVSPPKCGTGLAKIVISGTVASGDAKTYRLLPFEVLAGTTRIEVGYRWLDMQSVPSTPFTQTVFDLGLWDTRYPTAAGFRGWSGSRQGKLHQGQSPIFVQSDSASRTYVPGPVETGIWYVDLGVAAVGPFGASWSVEIECKDPVTGATPPADPVDAAHVARPSPGWFHGDFHMHGFHSNPAAPDPLCTPETCDGKKGFVAQARDAKLDFLMITDYVTGRHWDELGAVARANPDLLIWPGREVITYFGHVNVHGETRDVLEYRHGFDGITLHDDVQVPVKCRPRDPPVLFQVNHPTIFPGPLFQNFCRGCEFTLRDQIDWGLVDSIELLTGPALADSSDIGLPKLPVQIQNPFMQSAIDLWDDLLRHGYKITGVSGSDSKGVDAEAERPRIGYGCSATAVWAANLSRNALTEAIRAGHAYVRTRGVDRSPELEFTVTTPDGQTGMFGDSVVADLATLHVVVRRGQGQVLLYLQNGYLAAAVPILADPFEHDLTVIRTPLEGPLGTFWRVETVDQNSLTTIGNPVFLRGPDSSGPAAGSCP
jgi:hypothetical protein